MVVARPTAIAVRRNRPAVAATATMVAVQTVLSVAGMITAFPPFVVWLPAVTSLMFAAAGCVVAARATAGPVRVFWRWMAATLAVFTLAAVSQATDVMSSPPVGGLPPISDRSLLLYIAAVSVVTVALLRLPAPRRGWRQRVTSNLDVAIVATAAAIGGSQYLRWFSVDVGPDVATPWLDLGVLVIATAGLVAVVKVMASGSDYVPRGVLWSLAPAGILGPLSVPLMVAFRPWPYLNGSAAVLPVAGLLFAVAAAAQLSATSAAAPAAPVPSVPVLAQRRDSAVPLVAVGLTSLLLVAVRMITGHLPPVLEAGAAVLLLLVVVRQALALAGQSMLLGRVQQQATHDRLTGLYNRHALTTAIQAPARNGDDARTVVLLDIDDFGAINNGLGTTAGDLLLIAYADRLRALAGDTAVVARLDGDTFGLLLPASATDVLLERLLATNREALRIEGYDVAVTASIGVATAPAGQAADLLRRADVALRAAGPGQPCAVRYEPHLDEQSTSRQRLVADMRRGLEDGEFHLVYQPIIDLFDHRVTGVEALIRWRRTGDGRTISPAEFIPAAESSGFIVDLGAWIIDSACAQAAAWLRRYGDGAPKVGINVSARQLLDPALPGLLAAALTRHGLPARMLTVELTETAVFGGGPAVATVHRLSEMGVHIALDDFGTGHSSLSLLRTCPVDTIKVDKSFVDGLNGTPEQEAIVTALTGIAATLHLGTVAEGVETAAQADRLAELGYRYAQGFHFARPMPPAGIHAFITAMSASAHAAS
jgi:diguanylate cyclase (GGDEF)-like protein